MIVGVHSDESVFKLKNLVPTDNIETRMNNVKEYADQVSCATHSVDYATWGVDCTTNC